MRTVLLDRDGVINANRTDHVKSWDEFVFLPGALDALRFLRLNGWMAVVVTNQAAIGKGLIAPSVMETIEQRMTQTVAEYGGRIEAVFHCPHRPDERCNCRKPRPGLLLQAANRFGLELDRCYLVGDALTDIAAGQAVGCECVLVQTGRGGLQQLGVRDDVSAGYHVASDLLAAVYWIVGREQQYASEMSFALAGAVRGARRIE